MHCMSRILSFLDVNVLDRMKALSKEYASLLSSAWFWKDKARLDFGGTPTVSSRDDYVRHSTIALGCVHAGSERHVPWREFVVKAAMAEDHDMIRYAIAKGYRKWDRYFRYARDTRDITMFRIVLHLLLRQEYATGQHHHTNWDIILLYALQMAGTWFFDELWEMTRESPTLVGAIRWHAFWEKLVEMDSVDVLEHVLEATGGKGFQRGVLLNYSTGRYHRVAKHLRETA